jgi:hypothetical protein
VFAELHSCKQSICCALLLGKGERPHHHILSLYSEEMKNMNMLTSMLICKLQVS